MKSLMPGTYKSNMKLSIVPTNKIDTVNSTRLYNNLTETDIHSEDYTEARVFGKLVSLPLSAEVIQSHVVDGSRWMTNKNKPGTVFENREFAKGRIDYILGSGETIIKVDTPISGMPEVKISLSGSSVYADHKKLKEGGSDVPENDIFGKYPSFDQFKDSTLNFAAWVESSKTGTNDNSLIWNYEDGRISLNPWVGSLSSASVIRGAQIPKTYTPEYVDTTKDVLYPSQVHTTWAPARSGTFPRGGAFVLNWEDNGSGPSKDVTYDNSAEYAYHSLMTIKDMEYTFRAQLTKLSDYSFKVNWTVPVLVVYAAASRDENFVGGDVKLLDSYAFVDYIKSVTVTLHGTPFNTDTFVDGYSYDDEGLMTTELKNTHTHSVSDSSVITTDSVFTGPNFRNLFNLDNVTTGSKVDPTDGELVDDDDYVTSDYIRMLFDSSYYMMLVSCRSLGQVSTPVPIVFSLAFYDEQGDFISGGAVSRSAQIENWAMTITNPNIKFLKISYKTTEVDRVQVELNACTNLYDEATSTIGILDYTTGEAIPTVSTHNERYSDFIPVNALAPQGYVLTAHRTAQAYYPYVQFKYCWYNENKEFVQGDYFVEDENYSARQIYPYNEHCVYLRISYLYTRANNMRVYETPVVSSYQRYHNPDWAYVVSDEILERYIDGRYMVECDVPARWCMDKQLRINDDVVVLNQKSNLILRDKFACIFRVKNITKKFVDNAYVYSLKLLEERSAYEFDFSSDKVSLNTNITLTDLFGSTGDLYKIASVTGSATKVNNKTFRTSSLNYSLHLVRDL